jgi:hypothetical protein
MRESPVQCAEEILRYGVTYTTAVTPHIFDNERRETAGSAESYWDTHGNLPAVDAPLVLPKYVFRERRLSHLTQLAFS